MNPAEETIGYARQSTKKQEESVEKQVSCLNDFALEKGWFLKPENIFTDILSGANQHRPGLNQSIQKIASKTVKRILLYNVSRLARETSVAFEFQKLVMDLGIEVWVYAYRRPLDFRNPSDRMIFWVDSVLSEIQRRDISYNVSWGMGLDAMNGIFNAGIRPYGYRRDAMSGFLVLFVDEAGTVKRIFREIRWKSLREICMELNDEKIPSPFNGLWTAETVRKILCNQAYLGNVLYRKSRYQPYDEEHEKRKRIPRPPDEWILRRNAHPPIISVEEWTAAHESLESRRRNRASLPKWSRVDPFLFRGLVWCGLCSQKMKCRSKVPYRWYDCKTSGCPNRYQKAERLEKNAVDHLVRTARQHITMDQVLGEVSSRLRPREEEDMTAIKRKIQDCQKRLALLDRSTGELQIIMDREFFQCRKREILLEMKSLEEKESNLFMVQAEKSYEKRREEALRELSKMEADKYLQLSEPSLKSFLRQVVEKIVVSVPSEKINIHIHPIPSIILSKSSV